MDVLEKLRENTQARRRLDEERIALVREAFTQEIPGRDIAEALGVSTPRVYQLRDGR